MIWVGLIGNWLGSWTELQHFKIVWILQSPLSLNPNSFENSLKGKKIPNNLPSVHTVWRPNLGNRASFNFWSWTNRFICIFFFIFEYVSRKLGLFQIFRDQFSLHYKKIRPQIVRCIRMLISFLKPLWKSWGLLCRNFNFHLHSSFLVHKSAYTLIAAPPFRRPAWAEDHFRLYQCIWILSFWCCLK